MEKNSNQRSSTHLPAAAPPHVVKLHVVRKNGRWAVREGRRVTSIGETQEQAIDEALAHGRERDVEVVVHDAQGRVTKRLGNSPAEESLLAVWNSIYHHPEKWSF